MNLSAIGASTASFRTQPSTQPSATAPAQRTAHAHHRRAAADDQATQSSSAFTQSQTSSTGALLDTLV